MSTDQSIPTRAGYRLLRPWRALLKICEKFFQPHARAVESQRTFPTFTLRAPSETRARAHNNTRDIFSVMRITAYLLCMGLTSFAAHAADAPTENMNSLEAVSFSSLSGNRVQIKFTLAAPASTPLSFSIDNPARIALDFPNTLSKLAQKSQTIGVGVAKSITTVEAKGRTRVVMNLVRLVPYETKVQGNNVFLVLEGGGSNVADSLIAPDPVIVSGNTQARAIDLIDFHRGVKGEGRVVVALSDPSATVDVRKEGGKIVVEFADTRLPERLAQRLDVTDFATPITTVETRPNGRNVRMVVTASGAYEHMAYQTDALFTVEVRAISKEELELQEANKPGYKGEKLSLNFQNIEVRAALQIIADFTGTNLVTADNVNGNLTLRLQNVPWDQALEIILRAKGLAMRQRDNIIMVAPAEEVAAREKQELEARKQIKELEQLHSELIQINYAKASEIAALLKAKENSLLSARGTVTVDERTNNILIQDVSDKLADLRKLITKLDIPVRQVLIESRVVVANNDFSKELGVRFGGTMIKRNGAGIITTSGTGAGTDTTVGSALTNLKNSSSPFPVTLPTFDNRLNVNLPSTGAATKGGRLGFAILGSDYLLDLELSAMQSEGRGEVISSPRVITANQREAMIEQGVEVPYEQATSSGATSVAFKKAVLSLKVKPQITPDDRVIMDLQVNKDSVGEVFNNVPSINTREVQTQVLVSNGETVVLGGIYENTRLNQVDKVPLLGDIPGLGRLFRRTITSDEKVELLIFVTPRIIKDGLGLQ